MSSLADIPSPPAAVPRRRDSRRRSIANRLFISASVLSIIILLVAGLILTAVYRTATEEAFDERLGVYLRALVAELAADRPDEKAPDGKSFDSKSSDSKSSDGKSSDGKAPDIAPLADPQFELTLSGWYWQISRLDGHVPEVRTSRSLFTAKLSRLADAGVPADIGGARRGYDKGPDDRSLRMVERVIDTGDNGIYLVQVAAMTSEIDAQMRQFEIDLAIAFIILAVVLVGSTALQLRFGLKPLRRLQDGVSAIRRGEAQSIEGVYPIDLAPLASELNLLIDANRDVVERARTQVGNLAHALKTPLSVIINEAERNRAESGRAESGRAGGAASDGEPYAAKVAEQAAIMRDQLAYYLERARAAVSASKIGSVTDVAPVVAALVRTFEKITRDRGLRFVEHGGDGVRFLGERQDLEEMIGNLVDNAGKWAAREVAITVGAEFRHPLTERSFFRVTIDDDGPGLPPEQRAAAMRRGERLDESKPGSGLGLSIVAELAELYGGAFVLDTSPAAGLRAELTLPAS